MKDKIILLIAVLSVINSFTVTIPSLVFVFVILVTQLFCLNKYDNAVLFILFGGVVGSFFAQKGIRFTGTILQIIGCIVLLKDLLTVRKRLEGPLAVSLGLIIFLSISVLLSYGGDRSSAKLVQTITTSFVFFFSFGHLIFFNEKHEGVKLSMALFAYASFMLLFIAEIIGGRSLFDIFSFGSFRDDIAQIRHYDDTLFLFNYQTIGLYACLGLSLSYMNTKGKGVFFEKTIAFLLALTIVLYSQSRQSIFTLLFLSMFMAYGNGRILHKRFFAIIFTLLIAYFWISSLNSTAFDFVSSRNEFEADSVRSLIRQTAWNNFLSYPIFGIGYGRFSYCGEYGVNVHNIVLEILVETGIIGLVVFGVVAIKSSVAIYKTYHGRIVQILPFLSIIIVYFLHLMVSSEMSEGINLFVILLLLAERAAMENTDVNIKIEYE